MSNILNGYDYVDTDSVKQILNAQYGKAVSMKDYIVVHQEKRTGIIFKKDIGAVFEIADGTQLLVNGYSVYCDDKYKDVVTKVLK